MARSVYLAGLGPGVGNGTVAPGLVELLSRPVAHLSRGATVTESASGKDIVNTVAITAIQAQR